MRHETVVRETPEGLLLVTPTPGRLRRMALVLVLVAGVVAAFVLFPFVTVDAQQSGTSGLREGVVLLFGSWVSWAVLGVLAVLLALDGRSQRKVLWHGSAARTSWLFGPLEMFVFEHPRAGRPPPEVMAVARRFLDGNYAPLRSDPERLQQVLGAIPDPRQRAAVAEAVARMPVDWLVGWQQVDAKGRSTVIELARVADESTARALQQRMQRWEGAASTRWTTAATPVAAGEVASILMGAVLRLPLFALLGFCLLLIALGGETLAMQNGRLPAVLPWDAEAEARVERWAWRFYSMPQVTTLAGRQVRYDKVHAELQLGVSFIDDHGRRQLRPLALVLPTSRNGSRPSLRAEGGPGYHIEGLARLGLIPPRVEFEVPQDLLALASAPDGALRASEVQTDPSADVLTDAHQRHWSVLTQIDAPGRYLPMLWTEPAPAAPLRIVYRRDGKPDDPVWIASQVIELRDRLIHADGVVYAAAWFALIVGGVVFAVTAPGRLRRFAVPAWLALAIACYAGSTRMPEVSDWLGIDRGLQSRIRDWLAAGVLPAANALRPPDAGVAVGHFAPTHSRYRELLAALDLLQPPPRRFPDLGSAKRQIVEQAGRRLQAMDPEQRHRLLRGIGAARMRSEGNGWLVDGVLAPSLCGWLGEPEFGAQMGEAYPAAIQGLPCG